jgi:hypothetical protein
MSSFDYRPLSDEHPYSAALYRARLSLDDADYLARRFALLVDSSALHLVAERPVVAGREITVRSLDGKYVTVTRHEGIPTYVTADDVTNAVRLEGEDVSGYSVGRIAEAAETPDGAIADQVLADLATLVLAESTDLVKDRHVMDGDREITVSTPPGASSP